MKRLSSIQTITTKYILTAAWLYGAIALPISNYNNFGKFDLILSIPLLVMALVCYLPMKITYNEAKLVISDWRTDKEYEFKDIKLIEYSKFIISFHPYKRLILTTNDSKVHKIYFIPRFADITLFSSEPKGRQEELLELWSKTHYG